VIQPILGLSIAAIVGMPLVLEDDLHSQEEIDQLVLAALMDQAQREYAGAKALLHLVLEVVPEYPHSQVFRSKVQATRRVVDLFGRLLKAGLSDPTRESGEQAPDA
jgi:hypothetical protein